LIFGQVRESLDARLPTSGAIFTRGLQARGFYLQRDQGPRDATTTTHAVFRKGKQAAVGTASFTHFSRHLVDDILYEGKN